MPSIGATTGLIVTQRIDEAIRATFDKKTRQDAYKFLNLSSKGSDTTYIIVAAVFGTLLTIAASFATSVDRLTAVAVVGAISSLTLYWTIWRRKKARRELDALVASNREYWLPIADRLKQVVLDAGKFEDGLLPTQATRIVH